MFNRIKRYKARFAGAIFIFGIAAFSILFYWKSNFGSSIAERLYSVLRAGEYHSKIVLEPEKPDFTNPVQAVGKTELLPEPNSTYNLEITGAAWETAAELSLIEEAEIQNREKVTNLEPEIGFSDSNPDEVQKIKTSKPNRRDKLTQLYILEVERYLNHNADEKKELSGIVIARQKDVVNVPESLSGKQHSKVIIDPLEQDLNQDPLIHVTIKEEKSNFSIEDPIANSEHTFVSKIYQETPVVASWELQTDTFEIRILENVNIEKWVWIQIQEKLKEIKNKTLQNKAPSLFASGKEILLYFPRRDESRRKNQPNPKKQEIVSTLSGYIRKDSNSLILERFLEVPNVNRKQMRYYAIRTNGPPPTVHKQV
ncbi:hypothetical protein LIX26_13905 [Leptospira borgpetersenii]|nr:hypothetical protein [Leptospira borgpetersenii]URD71507.1 hypothetical protein LIX26_13905 [Leptospira borgpetersenii]